MKRILYYSLILTLLGTTGCIQTPDEAMSATPERPYEKHTVNIEGAINHVITTRATDKGFADGDAVGIYVVNYENGGPGTLQTKENHADNVKYMFDFEEYKWIPEYDIYFKDDDTHVDLIGYYPYADPSSVSEYPFEVERKQNAEASHGYMGGYEASDFLWSKATDIAPTEKRIKMTFHHKMAGVYVTLVEGNGWAEGEWVQLKKEVLVKNTIRKSNIDLATGAVTPTGEKPIDDIIPYADGYNFRAVVVPQSIEAGISLFSITVDGTPYNYKYKVDGTPTNFEYVSGKMHKFTLEVSRKEQTGVEFKDVSVSISAWEADNVSHTDDAREYVVIHNAVANQLERHMVDRLEMDVAAIKNLKLTGEIGADDYSFMSSKMTSLMRLNLKEVKSFIGNVYCIPGFAFSGKTSLVKCILPDQLDEIGYMAFSGSSLSGTIIIPEGVKRVSGFDETKITNLQFPSTLEEIGENAFENCNSLMCEVSLPSSLKRIENNAFTGSAIKGNLILPDCLEHIGECAFQSCSNLTGSLTIPSSIDIIHSDSFAGCGFTGTLTLPMGLTEIHASAFRSTKFKGELNIPSTVTTIGDSAFENTLFNGTPVLPKELTSLGSRVFCGCWRLSGVVEIPYNIIAIPTQLFKDCKMLEGIVLHKDVEVIESQAFANCNYIYSIVCKAKNAPTIASNSFTGVAKDNFVVEVPETSVKQYQNTSYWNEFKRIEAHREFSVSRNLIRTLNAVHTKTLFIRALAGEEWCVESCPEWVTVTPSNGVGKTEVTIKVHEMPTGHTGSFKVEAPRTSSSSSIQYTTHMGRADEIVFISNEKSYRSRVKIEQYDYQYGDGDLITHQTAAVGKGVNIVLMGDCFDARDIAMGKYIDAMNEAYPYFFDIEPYSTYKDYFNVYSIFGMSADSGMGTVNTIRESRFGSQYTLKDGVLPDFETIFAGACVAPINDDVSTTLIILVENSNEYSGLCYMYGDGSAIAICPMSSDPAPYDFRGIVHHEAGGHGFGKLSDEYIYYNTFIPEICSCCNGKNDIKTMKSYGFYDNVSLTGDWNKIEWSHLIFDPQYSNVVDVYEGAHMHTRGVYRSEATSCMNNNIPYYNAISREAMVKRIMKYAGEEYSFEAFKAKDYESLPSDAGIETRAWNGDTTPSSCIGQHAPKFMGEKPIFDKSKF